jgi:hypothetical protein
MCLFYRHVRHAGVLLLLSEASKGMCVALCQPCVDIEGAYMLECTWWSDTSHWGWRIYGFLVGCLLVFEGRFFFVLAVC